MKLNSDDNTVPMDPFYQKISTPSSNDEEKTIKPVTEAYDDDDAGLEYKSGKLNLKEENKNTKE